MKMCLWLALVALVGMSSSASAERSADRPGRPSFDTLLNAFDDNDDAALAESEVPERVWMRLSQADADDDGVVTRAEFDAFKKPSR